jgi:hypothetical protein
VYNKEFIYLSITPDFFMRPKRGGENFLEHKVTNVTNEYNNEALFNIIISLEWCLGQHKRIAPLSFFHGCRKRRLKDY